MADLNIGVGTRPTELNLDLGVGAVMGVYTAGEGIWIEDHVINADVTQAEVDERLNGKADASHTHAIADTMGLQAALDGKASLSDIADMADGMAKFITRSDMDAALADLGIATPLDYANAKTLMANAGMFYPDGAQCVNVLAMAEVISALCRQIDANASAISGVYTKSEIDAKLAALDANSTAY